MILFRDSLPKLNGKVRFLHAIPGAPSVDVYANGKLLYSNLNFGNITDYIDLSAQKYDIKLYKSGTYDIPLNSESIEILPNSILTLNVINENNAISLLTIDDVATASNPLLSYIRFINLSPDSSLLSLSLPEGIVAFDETSYLETNDYYPTSPGIYNFIVSANSSTFSKYISDVQLKPNIFITIYIIGFMKGKPQIGYVLVKDGINK